MNPHPGLDKGLEWLLNHSLQAGVLVVLVLAIQWVFRRQLTARWRFALWWIVLGRLLLPFNPESAVSLFNLFQPHVRLEAPERPAPVPLVRQVQSNPVPVNRQLIPMPPITDPEAGSEPAAPAGIEPGSPQAIHVTPTPLHRLSLQREDGLNMGDFIIPGLAGLWLAGVFILTGVVARQSFRFRRKLMQVSVPAGANLRALLDDCCREFGISRRIELWETDAVQSPALSGLWRLRLLLPRDLGSQFAGRELRYIFLHELAHVKRGDLWLNWLVTGLQIVHWFNPFLWLGFARLRADRELACDELALLRAGDNAGTAYGETVVKLLAGLNRPMVIPGLIGILEDKKQMRRRISMIANFRRPGRWSVLAVLLVIALAAAALTDASTNQPGGQVVVTASGGDANTPHPKSGDRYNPYFTEVNSLPEKAPLELTGASQIRPDLTGTVSAKDGTPLPVPAMVFVMTAAPRSGTSTFCPSCYADCGKRARTDAEGNFKIGSLDPQLTFQILAVAKGYQPKYVSKVDPLKHTRVNIDLETIAAADATPDRCLYGHVVDAKGRPIEGAVVEMRGIETRDGGSWGSLPGIDPLAITDNNGDFLITAKKPFQMMTVNVTARTYADKVFRQLDSGATPHELVMTEGATLTGRVLLAGRPLAGISVGVSGTDRSAGNFAGHFEVGTDAHGKFELLNLPPDADFLIYTLMSSMKRLGAAQPRQIHTGKDGETTDAGDLVAVPAHRLAGRIVLADGQPLPTKTRLLVSREEVWDSVQIIPDADGRFEAAGIPSETISLSARVKGYHVSARNASVDQMNPYQLVGRMDHDITNLIFLLEKGPSPSPDYSQIGPEYEQVREHSLRGAEGRPDHSLEWSISGHVLDGDTKRPLQNFRVTPGQTDNFNQTTWDTLRAVDGLHGVYRAYLNKRVVQPMLKVEANGYLPEAANLLPQDATNVDFVLKRGSGPAGTVVTPDNKPAPGVTVVLLNDEMNQAGFNSAGDLMVYGNRLPLHTTDLNGRFSLPPVWGAKWLAAASANGFTCVSLDSLAAHPTVTLQPFGQITGILRRPSGPGTNEILDVAFTDNDDAGHTHLNLDNSAQTDSQGRFSFNNVPAGQMRISYRIPMNLGSWQNVSLQDVEVKPGQTLQVNINAPERQAPDNAKFQLPPPPKLIPGVQIEGVVLSPDGSPAADADVALQVENVYLVLGKGAFMANDAREKGLLVSTGPDGHFSLPMYKKAQSVIALNEEGFARVSLDQLKATPQIRLQKWGRIEGTLRLGHHPGTNEVVLVSGPPPKWWIPLVRRAGQTNGVSKTTNSITATLPPLYYDLGAFRSRTDEQGRFAITFVPPGEQVLSREVPAGENSWTSSQLAIVDVAPGETVVTNVGGMGRIVIGKLNINQGSPVDFKQGMGIITTPTYGLFEKSRQLKTDAERAAFYRSPEFMAAMNHQQSFSFRLASDGSFKAQDILPGHYELVFQPSVLLDEKKQAYRTFASAQEYIVPEAKSQDDDSTVDLGTIELNERIMSMGGHPPGKK